MPTIKDVAKKAGLSVSTVSLVLNNSPLVNENTREHVLRVIKELGYQPNQYARSLVTKRKKVIGVARMLPGTSATSFPSYSFQSVVDTYLSEMLKSIEDEIKKTEYSMLMEWCHTGGSYSLPSIMGKNRVDGMLIVGGIVSEKLLDVIAESGIKTVLAGVRHKELDYVDTDAELGIRRITEYIIAGGHRDILFLNAPKASQSSKRKKAGFLRALADAEMTARPEYMTSSDYSGQQAYDAAALVWKRGLRPTAVIAGSDAQALGVIRFLYDAGLRCPSDVSVTGFEDSMLSEYATPALTTVCVQKEDIGAQACRLLLSRIERPNTPAAQIITTPSLILRSSVKRLVAK